MTSTAAENYQLKWHSHMSNLNTSVSTLYRNEKFADVMLLTSNQEGGSGIPAHKIILSSCSHFFANIFENNPLQINSLMYIVLPPELSRRSINILIQYMYSGEATVSNDILNEVLRGGEILKIRGLWRNQNNNSETTNGSSIPEKSVIEHSSKQKERRESAIFERERSISIPVVQENHTIIPKDSPVIVMATNPTGTNQRENSSSVPIAQHQQQQPSPIIQNQNHPTLIVKKDVAIDPGDTNNIPSTHYGLVSLQIAAAVKKAQQTNEKRLKTLSENCLDKIHMSEFVESYSLTQQLKEIRIPDKKKLSVATAAAIVTASQQQSVTANDVQIPEALNFLTIKQEPADWLEFEQNGTKDKHNMEITVKPELIFTEGEEDSSSSGQEPIYSPLTCELCSATFTIPGEWVRHIESHADTTTTIPKKRRRIEDENASENIASLRCDLCSMYFATPAEWVRHVQNIHTETELAISNNSALPKRTIRQQRPNDGPPLEKQCPICSKIFPSYASMVIHKRTHTGERPFYCSLCNKGFNVKSNLLRHMRTLHNQMLNTTNCHDGGENSNPE